MTYSSKPNSHGVLELCTEIDARYVNNVFGLFSSHKKQIWQILHSDYILYKNELEA
jgi:hypothetical protein